MITHGRPEPSTASSSPTAPRFAWRPLVTKGSTRALITSRFVDDRMFAFQAYPTPEQLKLGKFILRGRRRLSFLTHHKESRRLTPFFSERVLEQFAIAYTMWGDLFNRPACGFVRPGVQAGKRRE